MSLSAAAMARPRPSRSARFTIQATVGIPGTLTYVRNITLLDGVPVIKVNGVVTTALTISTSGLVTFTTPPPAGHY